MTSKIRYLFDGFRLDFNADTGDTITTYQDGTFSGCLPVPEDEFHGERLGIHPNYHRLVHELAHHLVGIHVLGEESSPTVRTDAMVVEATGKGLAEVINTMPEKDQERFSYEETLVTALTYYSFDCYDILREQTPPYDDHPLIAIATKIDLDRLSFMLEWLLEAPVGAVIDLGGAQW